MSKAVGWEGLHDDLKAVSYFLKDNELKMRFCHCCVRSRKERAQILRYVGRPIDWKRERVSAFLTRLIVVLPILQQRINLDAMLGNKTVDGGLHEIAGAIVRQAFAALARPGFLLQVQVLRVLSSCLDRQATWCEGCHCHEHLLLQAGKPFKERAREFREASAGCPWKGCRGVQLALGQSSIMQQRIEAASDSGLREALAKATPVDRASARQLERAVKNTLVQLVQDRLRFWESLPYKLLGIFSFPRSRFKRYAAEVS